MDELIQRLQDAERGSRELDRAVCDCLGLKVEEWDPGDGDVQQWRVWADGSHVEDTHVTQSIDAVLALVERAEKELISIVRMADGWRVEIKHPYTNGHHADMGLAICIALLKAKASD